MEELEKDLIRHEGVRLRPYRCTSGKLTIGVGRNLDTNGISQEEAIIMLKNDIKNTRSELHKALPWVQNVLSPVQQDVLVNMAFNLGVAGLLGFKKFLAALKNSDFNSAADEMLNSKWASQVGNRAKELAEKLMKG